MRLLYLLTPMFLFSSCPLPSVAEPDVSMVLSDVRNADLRVLDAANDVFEVEPDAGFFDDVRALDVQSGRDDALNLDVRAPDALSPDVVQSPDVANFDCANFPHGFTQRLRYRVTPTASAQNFPLPLVLPDEALNFDRSAVEIEGVQGNHNHHFSDGSVFMRVPTVSEGQSFDVLVYFGDVGSTLLRDSAFAGDIVTALHFAEDGPYESARGGAANQYSQLSTPIVAPGVREKSTGWTRDRRDAPLVINDGRLPNRDAGTISFWVKPEGIPFSNAEEGDNGDEQMIVYLTPNDEGRGNGFGEDPEMHMHRMSNRDEEGNITDERVDWYTRSDGDDINEDCADFEAGRFNHFLIRWSLEGFDDVRFRIYHDGQECRSRLLDGWNLDFGTLRLGGPKDQPGLVRQRRNLDGVIDEVYIFNSDRDEAQAFATSHEWSSLTRHESCIP